MQIKIGSFEFTAVWDGVLYKKLSQYPAISDWEKRNIIEFVEYEASHGRECTIECENADILAQINQALQNREIYRNVPRPALVRKLHELAGGEENIIMYTCYNENAYGFYEKLGMHKPNDVVVLNNVEWTDFTVE